MDRAKWLKNRIRWRIGRHFSSLALGRTYLFEQLSEETGAVLNLFAKRHGAGLPVLAAVDSLACWTLLGTSAVVSFHSGMVHLCHLDRIEDLRPRDEMPEGLSEDERDRWNVSWEYLRITGRGGRCCDIWLSAGSEAYAFWSTLLMLGRMCAGLL